MEYRKFKADYLFNGTQMLDGGQVLITDLGGKFVDIVAGYEAGEGVEVLKGILSPGFITRFNPLNTQLFEAGYLNHTCLNSISTPDIKSTLFFPLFIFGFKFKNHNKSLIYN